MRTRLYFVLFSSVLAAIILSAGVVAFAVTELQPNLNALEAKSLRLEDGADGRTYLRFSTTTWNSGTGPLEVVAGEVDTVNSKQKVYQRIYSNDGSYRDVLAGSFVWHAAHNHLHFEDYALYTLQPIDAPGASDRIGSKTTFCIIDTDRIDTKLPGAPKKAQYTSCSSSVQGLSVGWGDTYKYYLAGQEIDVTGLPDGDYDLTIEVDPKNKLVEIDDADNTSVIRIRLSGGTVSVIDDGGSPGNGNGRGGNGRGPGS